METFFSINPQHMSKYVEEVMEDFQALLEKNDADAATEFVKRKLSTSWRNGYKAGYQDGKIGNPDRTDEDQKPKV